jgi:hypothetical protein
MARQGIPGRPNDGAQANLELPFLRLSTNAGGELTPKRAAEASSRHRDAACRRPPSSINSNNCWTRCFDPFLF